MPRLPDVLMSLVLLLGAPGAVPGAGADPAPDGVWPLEPEPPVAHRFDPPDRPWLPGHRGVDLEAVPGQWVRSALPGRVRFSGPVAGKQVVVVDHGATRTTYEPVLPGVSVGDAVEAGERIGWLLAAPSHCAPAACLHWGWREGGTYLDPLLLVGAAAPIRLLPLWSSWPGSGPDVVVGGPGLASGPWMGLAVGVT